MANLYRKPVVRTDKSTGEKVKTKSKKWWGQYRDASGRLRRHPLATDKTAAQAMLNNLVRGVEREKSGLVDPTEHQRKRPLKEHLEEFEKHLKSRGVSNKQRGECMRQIEKTVEAGRWFIIGDITATAVSAFLDDLRNRGRSAQTCNNYLRSVKQFTRWLVRERRTPYDPLSHLTRLNVRTDRRHDRRALSEDEFSRLIAAARVGRTIEGISGPDRAMLYTMAAWTGFRKGELGSLTIESLDLKGEPATAKVAACYSKRKREDTQVLHVVLARQLRAWLKQRKPKPGEPLFPVSGRVPGGTERKTHKMMRRDLESARKAWIEETRSKKEKRGRAKTDFLAYCNDAGLYADFHSCRHLFITNLEKAGVRPKVAQTLARHSDIRLTLGVYTHSEQQDNAVAIAALPGPPGE